MSKIRVGIIGAGSWTVASHLPNLAAHKDVEFVAVARKGVELLTKIKDKYDFKVASEDYKDVLAAGVDVVVVGMGRPLAARTGRVVVVGATVATVA